MSCTWAGEPSQNRAIGGINRQLSQECATSGESCAWVALARTRILRKSLTERAASPRRKATASSLGSV